MADGFGYVYGGRPNPYWLSSPSPLHPAFDPPFVPSHPVESYDPTTHGGFDPMISHRSPPDWSNFPSDRENSRSQTPASLFYADNTRLGNYGPRGEDSDKDGFSPNRFYSPGDSSSYTVQLPTENFAERQQHSNYVLPTYKSAISAPMSSLAEMLISHSEEPFYKPIAPSVYSSTNAIDETHPRHYHPGYDKGESMNAVPGPPAEPYMYDSIPMSGSSSLKTQALLNQTGIRLGDGRSFPSNSDHVGVQSNLRGSSVEPVNFDVLLGYGEATGQFKPLSENSDLRSWMVGSSGSRSPRSSHQLPLDSKASGSRFMDKLAGNGVSSLYHKPDTLVADKESGVPKRSSKNAIFDVNMDDHITWNCIMSPSERAIFESRCAQSAVNYKPPFRGSANQPTEDIQSNQKPCNPQEQIFDMSRDKNTTLLTDIGLKGSTSNADDISTDRSPERHLCDQGYCPSPTSPPRVSSVVNAMHNLSEVLVYECFNNGSLLKLEQLENLDKVVDNLTKCLKKITGNKTIAGESSLPTQAIHVSSPNAVNHNEAPKGVANDFQGFNVKPLDNVGFKESVDKNAMTQSIKNILASNFSDGEENNNPQTLLYKNLWLETEAALCSTTCMARFHRIKNEIGNLNLQSQEISADASTSMQEPSLNPENSVPIMNNGEKETSESLIKHGSNSGNDVATKSRDAPQISRFNSVPADAILSLMSRSFMSGLEQTTHGNFKSDSATTSGKETSESLIKHGSNSGNDVATKSQDAPQMSRFNSVPADAILSLMSRSFMSGLEQTTHGKFKLDSATTSGKKPDSMHQILNQQEKGKVKSQNGPDSNVDVIDRFQILKRQETNRNLVSQNCPEPKNGEHESQTNAEASEIGKSIHVGDVMDRFQILKRREAEELQKAFDNLDIDSDSDIEPPRSKPQIKSGLMMTRFHEFHPKIEACVDTEPSPSGHGYESPNSDWEHILEDD